MIKKLKKKMLITIMIFVTVIVTAFLAIINIIPMQRSYSEAINFLERSINHPKEMPVSPPAPRDDPSADSILLHSNLIQIHTTSDGSIESWSGNREDLYDDEIIAELAEKVISRSRPNGVLSDYYYVSRSSENGTDIAMMDAHFSLKNMRTTLLISVIAGLLVWFLFLLMSIYLVDKMTQPISEAFIRQRQFISDAGHELKSPVAVISANADVLARETGDSKWLSYIRTETSRMGKLIESLMTLAQIDDDDKITSKTMIDLSQTVLGAALPMESLAFENGTVMEFDVQPDIQLKANKEQIEQLVVILLTNAIKYGQEKGFIKLFMARSHKSIVLSVFNTGIGIKDEDKDRIFDRFYRVEKERSRKSGSYGLGLSIARAIVDEHNGSISVESNYGENVTFKIIFPA